MKTVLAALPLFGLCLAVGLAQPASQPVKIVRPGTPAAAAPVRRTADPAAQSNLLAKTGGILMTPASGPAVLFLNTQTRVPGAGIQAASEQIFKLLRLPCEYRDKPSDEPVAEAIRAVADPARTAAAVVICETPGYPSLLLAPEARWALVNVAALGGADVPAALLAERTRKQVWRAFGHLMGAANSTYESCLLKPVFTNEELDALGAKGFCPDPLNPILQHARKRGISQSRMTTYRKAVEEGWAPAPTNALQQAIWDELKK